MSDAPMTPPCMVRYRTQEESRSGVYTAILVKVGRKFAQVIMMDSSGIRVRHVKKEEQRHMWPIEYDLEHAKELFRDAVLRYNKGHVTNSLTEALHAKIT